MAVTTIPDLPVLGIDTCSILDMMRDPVRDSVLPDHRRSVLTLLAAAEAGQLNCFMAEQVALEFASYDARVQEEARTSVRRAQEQMERLHELATIYGAIGSIDLAHLDDHATQARAIVGRWLSKLQTIVPSAFAPGKAFTRVNANHAPARQGKDSSKDCLIYETVLEHAAALRAGGVTAPIVFLSSNTSDYCTQGGKLIPAIAAEFAPLNIAFAPNISAAKHELRL